MRTRLFKTAVVAIVCPVLLLSTMGCSSSDSPDARSGSAVTVKNPGDGQSFDTAGSIEPTTLLDDEFVSITATGLDYQNNTARLDVTVVNKTELPIQVQCGSSAGTTFVNQYMYPSASIYALLDPSKTSEERMSFGFQELGIYGITQISEIGFGIKASYNDYANANYEEIATGSALLKTSLFEADGYSEDSYIASMENGSVLQSAGAVMKSFTKDIDYSQNGIAIKSLALVENKDQESTLFIEFENLSDIDMQLIVSDVMVNGIMAYEGSWTAERDDSGKIAVMDISLDSLKRMMEGDEAGALDLSSVETVQVELSAVDESGNTVLQPSTLEFSL